MSSFFEAIVTAPGAGWGVIVLVGAPIVRRRGIRGGWWW